MPIAPGRRLASETMPVSNVLYEPLTKVVSVFVSPLQFFLKTKSTFTKSALRPPMFFISPSNIIFDGEIKNIGGRRADFVKVDFVFRKNWSGETKTLTTFVKGSYNTFDTGIVSDASLLPGAIGKFDLYVPQDFGAFIGYSYVIDWEEYQ